MAAACDGRRCPTTAPSPDPAAGLERRPAVAAPGAGELDRWQAQVLGRVLMRAEVWVHSTGLSEAAVRSGLMSPVGDVATAVREALIRRGPRARLCVLPRGPLTVATPLA